MPDAFDDSLEVVPPSILATPSIVQGTPDEPIHWWQPDWRDTLKHMGYRWLYFVPMLVLLMLVVSSIVFSSVLGSLLAVWIKLFIAVGGLAFALAAKGIRAATRARKEPFCIYCGYNLSNLPDDYRCPECGRAYTWALIAEYRRDPKWFIERWKAQHELPPAQRAFASGTVKRKRRATDGTE